MSTDLPPPVVPPSDLPSKNDLLITAVVAPMIDAVPDDTVPRDTVPRDTVRRDALPTLPVLPPAPANSAQPAAPLQYAGVQSSVVANEVQVKCPNCETVWEGSDLRPHAQWFCGKCDYPLFWALPPKAEVGTGDPEGDGAFSRLPGTDGRETLTSMPCPHCGERNLPDPTRDCLRCGLPLTPRHEVAAAPVFVPVVAPPPPPAPPKKRRVWLWIVAAVVVAAGVAATVLLVLDH